MQKKITIPKNYLKFHQYQSCNPSPPPSLPHTSLMGHHLYLGSGCNWRVRSTCRSNVFSRRLLCYYEMCIHYYLGILKPRTPQQFSFFSFLPFSALFILSCYDVFFLLPFFYCQIFFFFFFFIWKPGILRFFFLLFLQWFFFFYHFLSFFFKTAMHPNEVMVHPKIPPKRNHPPPPPSFGQLQLCVNYHKPTIFLAWGSFSCCLFDKQSNNLLATSPSF